MKTANRLFILLCLCWLVLPTQAQQRFSVSGYVRDAESGENLTGVTVRVKEKAQLGTASNNYGFYSLTLPAGEYTLVAQFLGFQVMEKQLNLNKNQSLNFNLQPQTYEAKTVEIVADRAQQQVESTQMGEIILPMEQLKTLPVLFGESDVLKIVQLMPGVKSGGEGNTGFYVRGGGADQNLVLLDEATVYNPGHMLNFFSVFNSDAIRSTSIIKGSMPARYGGRLSSVLDISMKEGNKKEFQAEGGVGLIASRLTVQGPIAKDKASFIVSGRRTYLDQLINPFLKNTEQGGLPYYFYDLNAKVNYELNERNRFYVSSYFGRDKGAFNLSDGQFVADFNWGNATVTTRWNHIFNNKLFMNLSAIYTDYQFVFDADFEGYTSRLFTGVKDYQLKADFDFYASPRHQVQFGGTYTWHTLRPRNASARNEEGIEYGTTFVEDKHAHEAAIYISDDWTITDALTVNVGLRGSYFRQVGPFTFYDFAGSGAVTDSTVYRSGETVRDFKMLEPRLSMRYQLNSRSSVKAGFSRNAQYLHLVSNAYTTLPLDIWVPSSKLVDPQRATQFALGYFRNFKENAYETSVEVYYKDLENQLEYREGFVDGPSTQDTEYNFVSGSGESYGAEFFVRKNKGKLQGWVGYTWSRSNRTFPDLNNGNTFPFRFDRRHDASVVASYKLNERWTLGGSFVYGTGQAITIPLRRYVVEGVVNFQYGDRNGFRMEPFHRLDLSATFQKKTTKRLKSSWTFAIYNVYARQNPFFYYIDAEGNAYGNDLKLQAKKVSVIPFPVPSVTWNFTF